jgi:hypothetical protein
VGAVLAYYYEANGRDAPETPPGSSVLPLPKQKQVSAGYLIPPREGDPDDKPRFLAAINESSQALVLALLMDEDSKDVVDWSDLSDDFFDDKVDINQQTPPLELELPLP